MRIFRLLLVLNGLMVLTGCAMNSTVGYQGARLPQDQVAMVMFENRNNYTYVRAVDGYEIDVGRISETMTSVGGTSLKWPVNIPDSIELLPGHHVLEILYLEEISRSQVEQFGNRYTWIVYYKVHNKNVSVDVVANHKYTLNIILKYDEKKCNLYTLMDTTTQEILYPPEGYNIDVVDDEVPAFIPMPSAKETQVKLLDNDKGKVCFYRLWGFGSGGDVGRAEIIRGIIKIGAIHNGSYTCYSTIPGTYRYHTRYYGFHGKNIKLTTEPEKVIYVRFNLRDAKLEIVSESDALKEINGLKEETHK